MGKSSPAVLHECSECGWRSTKWAGRCGGCQAWGTVVAARVTPPASTLSPAALGAAVLGDIVLGHAGLGGTGLGGTGLGGTGLGGTGLGSTGLGSTGLGSTARANGGKGGRGPGNTGPAGTGPGSDDEAGAGVLPGSGARGSAARGSAARGSGALPISQVSADAAAARATGLDELDRVLGGGLVPGSVVLLAGEPGVGKSTLLLEAGALAAESGRVLYVTGEESAAQVRLRADRVGAVSDSLFLAAETDFAALLEHVRAVQPGLLIVDSVQTITAAGIDGAPGGVSQVREITSALMTVAKQYGLTTVLVGHVTKDGSIAGPRSLEHLVDVVLHFDGDRHGRLRLVRALKNRFGPTDEVGCFELGEYGLIGLPDPSGLFLSQRQEAVPGTCVTVTLEGRRPLPAEVQTLVCDSTAELARRVVSGLDSARVGMVVAVLQRRAGVAIGKRDVYAATVGGVRVTEPAADLALALALASATADLSLPGNLIAVGEVGLAGEIRGVTGVPRRLAEAERMGFRRAIVPRGSGYVRPAGAPADSQPRRGDGRAHLRLAGSKPPGEGPAPARTGPASTGSARTFSASAGPASPASDLEVIEVADIREAIAAALAE